MKACFYSCILFLFGAIVAPAARASFAIMPMEVQQKMTQANYRLTDDIEVHNSSDAPIHISGSITDWTLTPDGNYEYWEAGSKPRSCATWIQLSPSEFVLPPKKSMRVRYTITAPVGFTDETRAMIFFQSRPLPTKGSNGMSLMVSTRMGCKVFVSPAVALSGTARISDMEMISGPKQRAKVSVRNDGAATFRAKGTLQVLNENGRIIGQGELKPSQAQVLPGATRDLWFEITPRLEAGNYLLKTVIDSGVKQLTGGELRCKVGSDDTKPETGAGQ